MKHHENIVASYGYPVFENLVTLECNASRIAIQLTQIYGAKLKNMGIVGRGTSGILIATAVTNALPFKPKITYCKKELETNHQILPYVTDSHKFIIVDDFMEDGTTMKAIAEFIRVLSSRNNVLCVAVRSANVPLLQKLFPKLQHVIS